MDEENSNANTLYAENICSRFDSLSLNAQFMGLVRYWIKKRVQQSYQSRLDLEQIANDSMNDFIVCVIKAEEPWSLKLKGLCRVITKRKVFEEVRRLHCKKRIGPSHLESIQGTIEVRDFHSDASPADQAEINDLKDVVLGSLSLRQQEIVKLDLEGCTRKQIATTLYVSTKTIKREKDSIAEIVRATRSEFNTVEFSALPKKQKTKNKGQGTRDKGQRTAVSGRPDGDPIP